MIDIKVPNQVRSVPSCVAVAVKPSNIQNSATNYIYRAVDPEEIICLMKKTNITSGGGMQSILNPRTIQSFKWSKMRSSSDENWKQLCYIIAGEEKENTINMVNNFSWSYAAGRLSGGTYI